MAKTTRKKKVFVSHVSAETDVAQWLKSQVTRDFLAAFDVFVSSDRSTIGAGSRWLDEVQKALKQADLQIVLCSQHAVTRPWVNFEAGAVWLRKIPVIPVCHSGMTPKDLPVPLSMLESVVLSQPQGLAKLYDTVAKAVGLDAPSVDFAAVAEEAQRVEQRYAQQGTDIEVVENPRVLCVASEQYAEPQYGFDQEVAILERYFPGRVTVERALSPVRLMDLLTGGRYAIVHVVMAVNRENGDLIFGRVNKDTRLPDGEANTMPPSSFAALLADTHARLVVLSTCNALLLAVDVATTANMAASDQDFTARQAAEWEDCFYRLLSQGHPLYKAFELTKQQVRTAPIRAIRQKDVRFVTWPVAP